MPLFFFHLCDEQGTVPDTEGMELADAEGAKREGHASALEMLADDVRKQRLISAKRIEVVAADGAVVAVYRFRDLLH